MRNALRTPRAMCTNHLSTGFACGKLFAESRESGASCGSLAEDSAKDAYSHFFVKGVFDEVTGSAPAFAYYPDGQLSNVHKPPCTTFHRKHDNPGSNGIIPPINVSIAYTNVQGKKYPANRVFHRPSSGVFHARPWLRAGSSKVDVSIFDTIVVFQHNYGKPLKRAAKAALRSRLDLPC